MHIYNFVNDGNTLCDFKMLVATSDAIITGIDLKEVRAGFCINWTHSIFVLIQEMGHDGN